ncbi:MAG: type II toxin-antitoxin system death-on-curing family toxin [Actinomycetota bacterium]|nr:type II toxin-antitoxin system death-on-curing family toxin [Actinomycetota bacterium]
MIVHYLDLADYLAIVAEVTGLDIETAIQVTNLDLADSALHAPQAGWGATDLYPDFVDKAAVLVTRLTKNHPLPDGNKRAAWVALRVFIELNDWEWVPYPSVDEAERLMLDVAGGTRSEHEVAEWLASRIRAVP